ncbi:hypothetical protein NK6_2487 [Bradyrhizobium diazoefficiens]|jgi:hypothetical protein|uniref:Uncharacterized protein n=1 Tax=Bradyrhizobium diazoefficiens TaxID=1355477 RepID=A0A0E4FS22_9BRAD|nr:hypothetical protein NK6_2487 [Bradyrhizobium diazoefficiens]
MQAWRGLIILIPGCAKEFTAALSFNDDQSHSL